MEPHRPLTRRSFVSAALVGLTQKGGRPIEGGFLEDGLPTGHLIRDRAKRKAAQRTERVAVVIVGGGVAGLSAAWRLDKRGFHDFVLLEMHRQAGGNARWGENEVSAYPYAAHYLPVPNRESLLVRELLEELGVLRNGEFEERYLCFSPQERLYVHGRWQEGLEPEVAATARDREEFRRFHDLVKEQRASGQFTVPLELGVRANPLQDMSMDAWLERNGFVSKYLRWYVDYACRDDYGAHSADTSAWAGIHYFAAREHDEKGPLTWPEGNGWIVRRLAERLKGYIRLASAVTGIEPGWRVYTDNVVYETRRVIFAAPTFLLRYLVPGAAAAYSLTYSPWVTANVTLHRLPREAGFPLAWDNVFFGSPSLGYVDATHQSLAMRRERSVWTWYSALADDWPATSRQLLLNKPWDFWRDYVLEDLSRAHPDIGQCVSRIDVLRLGHAMVRPVPGFRSPRRQPVSGLWLANSDLSGISIFEQAQWNGVQAADAALRSL